MMNISISKLNNNFTKFILAVNSSYISDSEFVRMSIELNDTALYGYDKPLLQIQKHVADGLNIKSYAKESLKDIEDFEDFYNNPEGNSYSQMYQLIIDNFNFNRFQLLERMTSYRNYLRVLKIN